MTSLCSKAFAFAVFCYTAGLLFHNVSTLNNSSKSMLNVDDRRKHIRTTRLQKKILMYGPSVSSMEVETTRFKEWPVIFSLRNQSTMKWHLKPYDSSLNLLPRQHDFLGVGRLLCLFIRKLIFFSESVLHIFQNTTVFVSFSVVNVKRSRMLTEHKRATRNGDANDHIAVHHLTVGHFRVVYCPCVQTSHRMKPFI